MEFELLYARSGEEDSDSLLLLLKNVENLSVRMFWVCHSGLFEEKNATGGAGL